MIKVITSQIIQINNHPLKNKLAKIKINKLKIILNYKQLNKANKLLQNKSKHKLLHPNNLHH